MHSVSALDWSVLVSAAVLVGFAKTAIGGIGAIATALFAAVLPARESTGALLPLLLVGDVIAVSQYRRHADWPTLLRLMPSVAAGVVLGAAFVARADLFKLPFSIALGLIDLGSLRVDALLVPALVVGAVAGRLLVSRIDKGVFENLVLAATAVASINLLR